MALSIFVPTAEIGDFDLGTVPPQICLDSMEAEAVVGGVNYTRITDIGQMNTCFDSLSSEVSKKQLRDCIKYRADALEWDNLTLQEQHICAAINIGTGMQILAAYPIFLDRVKNSFNYICIMRGNPRGEAQTKAFYISAIVFAACKHIEFGPVGMPQVILTFLNCDPAKRGVTIEGMDYLKMYVSDQLQGFYKGDGTTGLYDFFTETAGSGYAGAGFPTVFRDDVGNPLRVTSAQWVAANGGFNNIGDFTAYCIRYLDFALF